MKLWFECCTLELLAVQRRDARIGCDSELRWILMSKCGAEQGNVRVQESC